VNATVHTLIVDDSDDDAQLIARELRRAGFEIEYLRVDKEPDLERALHDGRWNLVIADYTLPQLDAFRTLEVVSEFDPHLPCVVVSGRTGEEAAVETMQRGAQDYVVKHRLARLGPVVERVLQEAQRRRHEAQTELALRELEQSFRSVVDTAMDAIVTTDADGTIETFNPAAVRLFGYRPEDAIGANISVLLAEPFGDTGTSSPERFNTTREMVGRHRHGAFIPVEVSISEALVSDRTMRTWIARDIRERKAFEAQLADQALRDPLTGLANRTLLVDHVASVLTRARRRPSRAALLFLDLDRFKVINDSLGHAAGDEVLRVVARRLLALVRPSDTVARLGGDEFVVLSEGVSGLADAELISERIALALAAPVHVGGTDVVVSASVGIAMVDDPSVEPETMVRDADVAMYRAKERGRNRVEVFDRDMRDRAQVRLDTERGLRHAIERGELVLNYQPLWSLATGDIVGFEALLRWHHPERGTLAPGEFLHVADETGLIVPIGSWIVKEAARQLARWARDAMWGENMPTIWVNVSARQLVHPTFAAMVASTLRGVHNVPFGIEITEHTLMSDPAIAIATTRELRDIGVQVAIDDFGTGYSSLGYLKHFPVNAVKIDRSFVIGVAHDSQDEAIVRAIVGLARALGLHVVAEGVETPEQLETLRKLGCDFVQGFLLAPPLPPDQAAAMVVRPSEHA
jgi:diguanylate cyclase (GGDEF)-like protein/PAS domain S-box-containing protein